MLSIVVVILLGLRNTWTINEYSQRKFTRTGIMWDQEKKEAASKTRRN